MTSSAGSCEVCNSSDICHIYKCSNKYCGRDMCANFIGYICYGVDGSRDCCLLCLITDFYVYIYDTNERKKGIYGKVCVSHRTQDFRRFVIKNNKVKKLFNCDIGSKFYGGSRRLTIFELHHLVEQTKSKDGRSGLNYPDKLIMKHLNQYAKCVGSKIWNEIIADNGVINLCGG